jgi:hypothetical protein
MVDPLGMVYSTAEGINEFRYLKMKDTEKHVHYMYLICNVIDIIVKRLGVII